MAQEKPKVVIQVPPIVSTKPKGEDKVQEEIVKAVSNSKIVQSCDLPQDIIKLIVSFYDFNPLFFDMIGEYAQLSNSNKTILQTFKSNAALLNKIFLPKSGTYEWSIKVDCIKDHGCKYIGVVKCVDEEGNIERLGYDDKKVSNVECLNSNLQSGCSGLRCAWDGSCGEIYYDFEDNYDRINIGKHYKTDDIVTVILNTDEKEVKFGLNGKLIKKATVKYKNDTILRGVVGFGYEQDTEQYTVDYCSWW